MTRVIIQKSPPHPDPFMPAVWVLPPRGKGELVINLIEEILYGPGRYVWHFVSPSCKGEGQGEGLFHPNSLTKGKRACNGNCDSNPFMIFSAH